MAEFPISVLQDGSIQLGVFLLTCAVLFLLLKRTARYEFEGSFRRSMIVVGSLIVVRICMFDAGWASDFVIVLLSLFALFCLLVIALMGTPARTAAFWGLVLVPFLLIVEQSALRISAVVVSEGPTLAQHMGLKYEIIRFVKPSNTTKDPVLLAESSTNDQDAVHSQTIADITNIDEFVGPLLPPRYSKRPGSSTSSATSNNELLPENSSQANVNSVRSKPLVDEPEKVKVEKEASAVETVSAVQSSGISIDEIDALLAQLKALPKPGEHVPGHVDGIKEVSLTETNLNPVVAEYASPISTNDLEELDTKLIVKTEPVKTVAEKLVADDKHPIEEKPLPALAEQPPLSDPNRVDIIVAQEPAPEPVKVGVPKSTPVPKTTTADAETAKETVAEGHSLAVNAEHLNGSEPADVVLLVEQEASVPESVAKMPDESNGSVKTVVGIGADPVPVIADRSSPAGTNDLVSQTIPPDLPLEESPDNRAPPVAQVPVTPPPTAAVLVEEPDAQVDSFVRLTTALGEVSVPNEESVMHHWIAASYNLEVKGYVSFGDEVVILCPDGVMLRIGEDWNVTSADYTYHFRIERILKDRVSIRANGREPVDS